MKSIHFIIVFIITLANINCNSSKQGTSTTGPDGRLISGNITRKCDKPESFTKSLDIRFKNSIDSLLKLPYANIDAGLKQTVTILQPYSESGSDMALMLYYVCQMTINQGYTPEQTKSLLETATSAWSEAVKKKNSP